MTRPESHEPVIVPIVDEIEALEAAGVPTGLRAHLEQVLIAVRTATPAPTWLDAGDLAALTSALVAGQVRQAASPA